MKMVRAANAAHRLSFALKKRNALGAGLRSVRSVLPRLALGLMVCCLVMAGAMPSFAHPISVTRTLAFVSPDQVTVSIDGFLEDLFLFHDLQPNTDDVLDPEEIMRGVELHKTFVAEKFKVREASGEPLKLIEVRLKDISPLGDGVPVAELMSYGIAFELRYELPSPPEYLTFSQQFTGELDLLPAEMLLQVKQENAGTPSSVLLMPNRSETIRFNWENPALSQQASKDEWTAWFEQQRQETLGITSYASVYSFLYIENHEVRHEILIPLATLNESVSLERDEDAFLDLSEQDAARPAIESHFLGGNPIEVDGAEIKGTVTRLDFYGVDFKDFARQAPRKRVPIGSARVGVIISYPTATPAENVKLAWNRFNQFFQRVNLVVIAHDGTSSTTLDEDTVFEWKNPGRSLPDPLKELEANLPKQPTLSLPMLSVGLLLLTAIVLPALKYHGSTTNLRRKVGMGLLLVALLGSPFLRWSVTHPLRPAIAIPASKINGIFETLLHNVYEAMEFHEEQALFDALSVSTHGELLNDIYLQVQRGLVLQDQGGAVSRVREVEILDTEFIPIPNATADRDPHPYGFGYKCRWNVSGTVEHWGHIHERTNQYAAVFAVEPVDGFWKITAMEILDETQLQSDTRLRRLTDPQG